MSTFDAILIPGGGVRADGNLPLWTQNRLDRALCHEARYLIALSAGTTHKPPPLDPQGFPIFESVAAARYLLESGADPTRILTETCSYDTIGNAWFAKTLHVDPLGLQNLLVITSEFHMPRTRAIFEWVFGLAGNPRSYHLDFESVLDAGMDAEVLAARMQKERESLERLRPTIARITTAQELHRWLFTEHAAYAASAARPAEISETTLKSY